MYSTWASLISLKKTQHGDHYHYYYNCYIFWWNGLN